MLQFERDFQPLQQTYRDWLYSLEAESLHQFHRAFADLHALRQNALLKSIEAGDVETDWKTVPRSFFAMLINHAAEGYYADPAQGGNRDTRSWEMIGF